MARPNRAIVPHGTYYISTRTAEGQPLLRDRELRRKTVEWIYGIAGFAGIDVLSWSILDDGLHLLVRVRSVPQGLWTEPGTVPRPEEFSQRPGPNRPSRCMSDTEEMPEDGESAGDCPRAEISEPSEFRALVRFMLEDDEMVKRLQMLYAEYSDGARVMEKRWKRLRKEGRDDVVEREKEALCRRMYNISRFMQTLKQRISEYLNRNGHSGTHWQGRFRSLVVENRPDARMLAAHRINCRAVCEGFASHPARYADCAFAVASGTGRHAEEARRGFELACGSRWNEARIELEGKMTEGVPVAFDPRRSVTHYRVLENGREKWRPLSVWQYAMTASEIFDRDGYVSRKIAFRKRVLEQMPPGFPAPSGSSLKLLSALVWNVAA